MSWESIALKGYLSGVPAHQLSATRLLGSPDNTRFPIDEGSDFYPFAEDFSGGGIPNGGGIQLGGFGSRFGLQPPPLPGQYRGRTRRIPGAALLDCFSTCRIRLNRYMAKRKIEQGVKLYAAHKQQEAVKTWLSALKTIRQRGDKFQLLGYLYQAYMDFGKYRESLEFAHRQLGISEELDSPTMRAEAYLNLARAHQTLGGLERALSYARQSLYNDCEGCSTMGYVHLTVGSVSLELGAFNKAVDSFQRAHKIAQTTHDNALLLQVYVGLSEVFGRLLDSERGAAHAARAYDLSRSLQPGDLNTRHHRAALLQMAASLRRQGELGDAHDYCTEAMRLSTVAGDQGSYARAVRITGDIYRRKCDVGKALRQYEVAMGAGQAMGDRLAQMEAMDGAARCLEALRLQQKICNCRPLEFNTRLLEVATSVGAKMLVRTVRKRLAGIYASLGDEEARKQQEMLADTAAPHPACPHCGGALGTSPAALEALPCSHIVHARCVTDMMKRRNCSSLSRGCAACQSPSRALLAAPPPPRHSTHELQDFFAAPSLPHSLRASNMTLNSDTSSHQITSSV